MICPNCKGNGSYYSRLFGRNLECAMCNGSGFVEEKKPQEQTNEEWLNSLAWDTKAYWLANTCSRAMWENKYDNNAEKGTLDYWKEWLKETHK